MRIFIFIVLFAGSLHPVFCQSHTALIIGIDTYKPEGETASPAAGRNMWTNLDGCVNDASSIRDMIVAKYAFNKEAVTTLYNQEASRERIISALKKIASSAKKGDVIFIYYAGHGSQVYNSLSAETDKKDESIVPADAYKGAPDIRDKELAALLNAIMDRGAVLTVIFDSCHSGSVGRGFLNDPPKMRFIEESTEDAKDASIPERPENRGALILSAAQDFEFAKEQMDENNIAHGAFTIALLKAMQQLSPDVSVRDLFSSITAIMKYYGKTQEPVLAASEKRKDGTLFGYQRGTVKNKLSVGVSRINARGIELMGGYAFGLSEGTRLAGIGTHDTLEVTEMKGANKSQATIISGDAKKILPGALFEVINWSAGKAPALKVYIPETLLTYQDLTAYIKIYQACRKEPRVKWITDISRQPTDRIYYFNEGEWVYTDDVKGKMAMGKSISANSILNTIKKPTGVFVNFPPATELYQQLQSQFSNYNNIAVVNDPNESQYTLVGRLNEQDELEYAFVKSQVMMTDTTESLPQHTDYIRWPGTAETAAQTAAQLAEYAFRIAKIRDWLMLSGPAGGQNKFPFSLAFQYYSSGKELVSDQVKINDTLSLYFKSAKEQGNWDGRKRYIYVFSIDSKGSMNLLFPSIEGGNIENRFPVTNENGDPIAVTHLADILVTPPAGADNYFMLSSEEAISNLSVFQQEGVLSRGKQRSGGSALESLLFTGTKSRSQVITPVNWSVNKLILRTTE